MCDAIGRRTDDNANGHWIRRTPMGELTAKDLVKIFKNAPWNNEGDIQRFVAEAQPVADPKAIVQLLDILCIKKLSQNRSAHHRRLKVFRGLTADINDRALFIPFVKALKSTESEVRNAVAELIPKVNAFDEHPKLAVLLKSPEADIRKTAAAVLKQIGGKAVIRVLGSLVEEKDFPGRIEAMEVVVPLAGHYAAPILRTVCEKGNPGEKIAALRYLGEEQHMGKSKGVALRYILPYFEDPDDKVVTQATLSFSNLCTENDYFEYIAPLLDSLNVATVQAAVQGLNRFNSPRVIVALGRKLRAGPNLIREEVLKTLEAIGQDEVLPLLVDALASTQASVRNQAAEILARLSNAGSIDMARTIIWLLQSRDVNVRRMSVEIAQKVKDPDGELWPKLLTFLRDEDWWVRERVKDALVEMAGKKLTPHMVELLNDPFDVVRRFAVEVLIQLNDVKALGALISAARDDPDWWTRERSVEAMAELKDERAVPYIVDIMGRDEQLQLICLQALNKLNARTSAPYVAGLLESPDPDIRIEAITCLGAFDATDMADRLQPLLGDENQRVVRAAEEQLVHWNIELSDAFTVTKDKAVSFLDRVLMTVVEAEADDLIICSQRKPYMKRMGQMIPISKQALTHEQVVSILSPHLSVSQMSELEALRDVDFSYLVKKTGARFRANVFGLNTGMGAVFRVIKGDLPDFEKLGLPDVVKGFGDVKHGLILVGGPTGSGKSTTLAALIDYINRKYDHHVISLEDPIEMVHRSAKGLVNQREIGTHTESFGAALRSTLREDPDVILVGEMRDYVTISFAVSAAETGHLVFGTVHTVSADTTIDRLINAFPAGEQPQVRSTLSENLRAVTCQYLLKRKDGTGRALAAEVMINNDAIASLIRNGKTYQIPSVIATSKDQGMQTMDNELMRLFKEGIISADDAYMKAAAKNEFEEIYTAEKESLAKEAMEGGPPFGGDGGAMRESLPAGDSTVHGRRSDG